MLQTSFLLLHACAIASSSGYSIYYYYQYDEWYPVVVLVVHDVLAPQDGAGGGEPAPQATAPTQRVCYVQNFKKLLYGQEEKHELRISVQDKSSDVKNWKRNLAKLKNTYSY